MRDLKRLMGHNEDDLVPRFRDIIDLDEQQECVKAAYAITVLQGNASLLLAHLVNRVTEGR